ncbi:MAG: YbaN family protein [Paludibacteraceae bacterium]|nr:YbaN family protein [Paludibacteraceae bacterium]
MKRIIYILLGSLCVGLGTVGVFVPGLPTTPFMLAASWLFYRSSPRLREKLLASWLGVYIRDYEKNKGLTPRAKIMAIIMMVGMSTLSITQFIDKLCVRIIVAIACLIGVVVVGFIVPTVRKSKE